MPARRNTLILQVGVPGAISRLKPPPLYASMKNSENVTEQLLQVYDSVSSLALSSSLDGSLYERAIKFLKGETV
jgi:hypothetical protein